MLRPARYRRWLLTPYDEKQSADITPATSTDYFYRLLSANLFFLQAAFGQQR
jgi:hypothetical protein